MKVEYDVPELRPVRGGDHICWVVDDASEYLRDGKALLAEGSRQGQLRVVFGPRGSAVLMELAAIADLSFDPRVTFLGGGPVIPRIMLVAFRELSQRALAGGYQGVRILADMDWLLPGQLTADEIARLEVFADRAARELSATIICTYRRASFDTAAILNALSMHKAHRGRADRPQFHFATDGSAAIWELSGEIDLAVSSAFAAALGAALSLGARVLDVAGVQFVDIAGLRAIASAARDAAVPVELRGASPAFRRLWLLTGLQEATPTVSLANQLGA
jgi:anti-anti-sigma factor